MLKRLRKLDRKYQALKQVTKDMSAERGNESS
jgi:hypothetical protein